MKKLFRTAITALTVFVLCFSIAGCSMFNVLERGDISNLPDSSVTAQSVNFNTQPATSRQELSLADAAEKVNRSVVAIKVEYSSGGTAVTGYGSGVIVDIEIGEDNNKDYYVITCHHVISSGGNVTVYVPDENRRNVGDDDYNEAYVFEGVIGSNKSYKTGEVALVGGDAKCDVAVLKLDASGKSGLKIAASQVPVSDYAVRQGEEVFAVGNPSGTLPMSLASGHISYIDRTVTISEIGEMELLQIDVPTNHGNSGGGLFNMYGELIGITNAGSDSYTCLNYAIPYYGTDGFVNIAKQLISSSTADNYGYITGRWELGITVTEMTSRYGDTYVAVASVLDGSNADNAGILVKDVIEEIKFTANGKTVSYEVASSNDMMNAMSAAKKYLSLGDKIVLVIAKSIGSNEKTVNLSKQLIFCDTGIYPETENNQDVIEAEAA